MTREDDYTHLDLFQNKELMSSATIRKNNDLIIDSLVIIGTGLLNVVLIFGLMKVFEILGG